MKIAYLYSRPFSEGEAMGAERTFADYAKTNRVELRALIEKSGLRDGDTLLLRAKSDLGKGRESDRILAQIEAMGVTVQILPLPKAPKLDGRPQRAQIKTVEDFDHICAIWYSPAPIEHAIQRASEIAGAGVDRNWVNYRCGPRDGSLAGKKRTAAMRKFTDKKEGQNAD